MTRCRMLAFLALFFLSAVAVSAGEIHKEVPGDTSPSARYLFYMHGAWVERHGPNSFNRQHGVRYEYDEIVRTLADRGFTVISETRPKETRPPQYARIVAKQIQVLIARGVPAGNITVAGHSKGGNIARQVSSSLLVPRVNYVIMAGCGREGTPHHRTYNRFLQRNAQMMVGRMLSLYDAADKESGTCGESFSLADLTESKEAVFETGRGHGLFYTPEPIWVDAVCTWAGLE